MKKQDFEAFFKQHSQNVDSSNKLGFWKLTDDIILTYLLEEMPNRDNVTLVDFGGGTGRWLLRLDKYFSNSRFIIVDLSEDMLAKAKKKLDSGKYTNSVELIHSDISSVPKLSGQFADYIISTYNPLSFISEPQKAVNEAFRILKSGGKALITVQGYYNALYSKVNNYLVDTDELQEIYSKKMVQWAKYVPKLWQLPKADMEKLFLESGFENVSSRGIACITQPQGEDFDPENKQLGSLSKKLNEDNEFYKNLLEIEVYVGRNQDVVDRGMNIMTIGVKS